MGYRDIARAMKRSGDKINFTTAHIQVLTATQKVLKYICEELDINLSDEYIDEISKSPEIHESLHSVLYLANELRNSKGYKNATYSKTQSLNSTTT